MQGHGDDVRHQNKGYADGPCGQRAPEQAVSKEDPVAGAECDFRRTNPPGLGRSQRGRFAGQEVQPRKEIEVEASNAHDGVVGVLLVGDKGVGNGIPDKGEAVVIAGTKRAEEGRACGEERHVLDIRIVLLDER